MKKTALFFMMLTATLLSNAQVEVTTKSFDLESVDKHKKWQFRGAGIDTKTGKTYINFIQPECLASSTSDASYVYTTYHGFKYNVDKLIFDDGFNYLESQKNNYASTKEAIENGIPIFGRKFYAFADPFFPYQIDNSYMFQSVVTYGFTKNKDVISSYMGLKVNGCGEAPKRFELSSGANRTSKNQTWYPQFSYPIPNGGNILYNTVGVGAENKQHYVFRKFDKDLNISAEQTFSFDYACLLTAKVIEKGSGEFDFVFIATPIEAKKSKLKQNPANSYEYFYVDGSSYEIKEHVAFTAPSSRWLVEKVTKDKNATYVVGSCGENNNSYSDVKGATEEDFKNLQAAKFEDGKLVYINKVSNADLLKALKVSKEFEGNSKVSLRMVGTTLDVINNKLVYQGGFVQGGNSGWSVMGQALNGYKYLGVQTFVINENGNIDAVLSIKGEQTNAKVSFPENKKKFYLFLTDQEKYNKFKDGMIYASKSRFLVNSLSVITYDFDSKSIAKYQNLENEEWAVSHIDPILMENEDRILMLGYKLTKKAKDSEVVFISIKK
jgi:hypothetical protein